MVLMTWEDKSLCPGAPSPYTHTRVQYIGSVSPENSNNTAIEISKWKFKNIKIIRMQVRQVLQKQGSIFGLLTSDNTWHITGMQYLLNEHL